MVVDKKYMDGKTVQCQIGESLQNLEAQRPKDEVPNIARVLPRAWGFLNS